MRGAWLILLPLLLGADWFPIQLIADPAARSFELPTRPAACYAMTVTGTCDTEPPAESGLSNVVCRPAGPTTLHWQAPTKCADDTFPVIVSLWTIYTDALPPQPRPAPPRLVTLTAEPGVSMAFLSVASAAPPVATLTRVGEAVDAIPGGQLAGDVIVAFAFRDGSTTAPSLPSGWTNIGTADGSLSCSSRAAWRLATADAESAPTFTNATKVAYVVYRDAHPTAPTGRQSNGGSTGTSVQYFSQVAGGQNNGNSDHVGLAGHRSVDTALETAPSGMTNRASDAAGAAEVALHTTDLMTGAWVSPGSISVGGTSSGWRSRVIEVVGRDLYLDLDSGGLDDWAHYGLTAASDVNRKSGGGSQISALTDLAAAPVRYANGSNNTAIRVSWSGGTPDASETDADTIIYWGADAVTPQGFSFTVPADQAARRLKLYIGGYLATGEVEASLSDASAADVTVSSGISGGGSSTNGGSFSRVVTIDYAAGSAAQTLTVTYRAGLHAFGNIWLSAITLKRLSDAASTNLARRRQVAQLLLH